MTREKAIKILKECKEKGFKHTFYTVNEYDTALDMAIEALEQEPCEDCISRQAAIDAVDDVPYIKEHPNEGLLWKAWIEQMPSAQPERTCVNCGRTVNNGGWYADGGTRCPIEEHYTLPKDGYCHLWEKRNVTDDDYPERRTDE